MDSPGVSGVESEFLYRELMWFSWINKSKSYKNNLKFMMLCAKKPMEIRPVFYVLNLNNVVKKYSLSGMADHPSLFSLLSSSFISSFLIYTTGLDRLLSRFLLAHSRSTVRHYFRG
ncbi:uncharacterized protein LOC142333085 isoform X1 [Lycorma delicatula]|uniref:uncharacterized protein LOC142333085 isoform X1 n=1 Tax=Lycorma delicatula TaxID=130591 RepID=UPI003F515E5A